VDQAFYQVDNKQSSKVSDYASMTAPNFRLDLSTDIQRIFDISGEKLQKIKHNIRPQIIYNYIPDVSQENGPTFFTPFTKMNIVTYYLTNIVTGKNLMGKGKEGEDLYSYLDFLFFRIYQSYDFNEANRDEKTPRITIPTEGISTVGTTGTTGIVGTTGSRRPFSDIIADLEIITGPNLRLRSFVGWSPYDSLMSTQTHTLSLSSSKGDTVRLEYQTTNGDQYRQLNSFIYWKINPAWTANFLNRWSIEQSKSYETTIGLAYNHQCWGFKALYTDTPDDKKLMFSFSLKGLGEF
jgi:LPS-assembly protein